MPVPDRLRRMQREPWCQGREWRRRRSQLFVYTDVAQEWLQPMPSQSSRSRQAHGSADHFNGSFFIATKDGHGECPILSSLKALSIDELKVGLFNQGDDFKITVVLCLSFHQ